MSPVGGKKKNTSKTAGRKRPTTKKVKSKKSKTKKQSARKPAKKKKSVRRLGQQVGATYHRRTFMFDDVADAEISRIQEGLGAPTASEAMRTTVKKMAKLMRHVGRGGVVQVRFDSGNRAIELDFPAIRDGDGG